ncbi:calcium uniporter protein, mitochondrial isoform X2 [Thrips palmi]|uniref:Calcium uniporter protein n=1 Tax=Thrips palmi TaxID=161013 RepID=A0A6P8YGD8_THRPL|nr:calcium uniporter protein, mitochondrial isoform X2 [Thrips palmi]
MEFALSALGPGCPQACAVVDFKSHVSLRHCSSAGGAASTASDTAKKSDPAAGEEAGKRVEPSTVPRDVCVEYRGGLPELVVELPSRREACSFRLRPVSHVVGDLIHMLKHEDRGIDRVTIRTMAGVRVGSANSIESLLQDNFKLQINDMEYTVRVPSVARLSQETAQQMSDVRLLVMRLYESLNVQEHQLLMERELLARLEETKTELAPMEEIAREISTQAETWVVMKTFFLLFLMGVQFGVLGRLTWWEYSWDIMEPVTYFVTYFTAMGFYAYSLVTGQECGYEGYRSRSFLRAFHRLAQRKGLDVTRYNELKASAYQIEKMLAKLRDPLQVHLPARPIDLPYTTSRSPLDQIRNLLNIDKFFKPSSSSKPSS